MTLAQLTLLYQAQHQPLRCNLRRGFPRASREQVDDAAGHAWLQAAHHRRALRADSGGWLYVVARHELLRLLGTPRTEPFIEGLARVSDTSYHDLQDALETLAMCKPDEIRAIFGQAVGLSRVELERSLGWTATKVNRCLSEGRSRARHLAASPATRERA